MRGGRYSINLSPIAAPGGRTWGAQPTGLPRNGFRHSRKFSRRHASKSLHRSWHHVAPGTQLLGERGTLEAIRQVQGFEAPANSWERQILKGRIADYDPKMLDQLCLTGAVGWGRLSPHPATLEALAEGRRRVIP